MATTPRGLALSTTYNRTLANLGARVRAIAGATFAAKVTLDGNLDDRFAEFADTALPVLTAGQRQTASFAAAFMASYTRAETGKSPRLPSLNLDRYTTEALRGTPALEVYRRSIITIRAALGDGVPAAEALARGQARVEQTARTDITLAARAATRDVAPDNVTGFQRVTAGMCCALCSDLEGEFYNTNELEPTHSECSCTVEAVFGSKGDQLDRPAPTVEDSPGLAEEADKGDLKVVVHEHGELGPVIYPAGQHFAQI